MVSDDGEASAGTEHFQGSMKELLESAHLTVDFNAESLEHHGHLFFLALGGNESGSHRAKRLYGVDRVSGIAGVDDGFGKASSPLEFAVEGENVGEPLLGVCFENLCGGEGGESVHAHVERTVETE